MSSGLRGHGGAEAYCGEMNATDVRARLQAALEVWQRTAEPAHASRFIEMARDALAHWVPPPADSARAFQRAWRGVVGDIVGRGWALDTLCEQLPGADATQRASALAKRMEVLARQGPDPRFAQEIHVPADVTWTRRLATASNQLEAVGQLIATVGLTHAFPPPTPEIEALWRDVHDHPEDRGALAVLADALQLASDPRGELLALQGLDEGDDVPERAARRKALIANVGAAWLGELVEVTAAASFERGALRRLELRNALSFQHPRWAALITSPLLATVTDLLPGDLPADVYARFVTSEAMPALRRIDLSRFVAAAAGLRSQLPASITHAACPEIALGAVTRALPPASQLRSIAIGGNQLDELLAGPWFRQLDALTLGGLSSVRTGLARWTEMPSLASLTLAPTAQLAPCTVDHPWDFGVTLRREGGATVARVAGEWLLLPADVLSALPRDTVRVEVEHASPAQADRIHSAIGRPALEVVRCPAARRAAVFVPPPNHT